MNKIAKIGAAVVTAGAASVAFATPAQAHSTSLYDSSSLSKGNILLYTTTNCTGSFVTLRPASPTNSGTVVGNYKSGKFSRSTNWTEEDYDSGRLLAAGTFNAGCHGVARLSTVWHFRVL